MGTTNFYSLQLIKWPIEFAIQSKKVKVTLPSEKMLLIIYHLCSHLFFVTRGINNILLVAIRWPIEFAIQSRKVKVPLSSGRNLPIIYHLLFKSGKSQREKKNQGNQEKSGNFFI